MKNAILTIIAMISLSACNVTTTTTANGEVEPHLIAGSEARKDYCKRRHTHTQKDYFDCVKGYGGQHSQYSRGVVYPEKNSNGGK